MLFWFAGQNLEFYPDKRNERLCAENRELKKTYPELDGWPHATIVAACGGFQGQAGRSGTWNSTR